MMTNHANNRTLLPSHPHPPRSYVEEGGIFVMDMEWEDLHDGRRRKKVRARGGGEFCGTGMYAKWVLWREGGGGGYDPSLSCPSPLPYKGHT